MLGGPRPEARQVGAGGGGPAEGLVHGGSRGLPLAERAPGAGGAHQDLRRCARAVPRPLAHLRVRRLPAGEQLCLLGRLRRPGQTVLGNRHPHVLLQDEVPRELFLAPRQPRVRVDHPNLRLLRRVQAPLQHQALEAVLRRLQLPASLRPRRREDHVHARRLVPRDHEHGPGPSLGAPHGRAGLGPHLRSALGGPGQGHHRLGRE
mmetsp:Transcript_173633/g.551219  ORF Transcript_173633/g.551219 Transcript_173633/m.551219 type:complete len:205 (+) Transcript_173633:143-757(+)